MSGLFAGLMLRAAGWRVDIFEKVEGELSGRGAGIVAQPEILAALRDLGVRTDALGVPVQKRRLFDADGRMTLELDCPQVMTAWERVYRILRDAFPPAHYHRGRALKAIEQDSDGVTAIFADGERVTGDVLIGADGIRSTVRGLCAPESPAALCRVCGLARADRGSRDAARCAPRYLSGHGVLPAAGRADAGLSGGGPRRRCPAGASAVQHDLVPARR